MFVEHCRRSMLLTVQQGVAGVAVAGVFQKSMHHRQRHVRCHHVRCHPEKCRGLACAGGKSCYPACVTRTVCNARIRCVRRWVVRRWVLGDVVLGDGKKPQFYNLNFFFLFRLSFSVPAGLTLKDFAPRIFLCKKISLSSRREKHTMLG